MSGILDSKTRVLDVVLTDEGRRQLASGKLRLKYASFTDDGAFYRADDDGVTADDATQRLYLENCELPQDQVTFQSNVAGKVTPFKNISGITIADGKIISNISSSLLTGSNDGLILSGSDLVVSVDELLNASIDSFTKLRTIGTVNHLLDDFNFAVSENSIRFVITNDKPLAKTQRKIANITQLEGLIADPRFSNQANFQFLPPIQRMSSVIDKKDVATIIKTYGVGDYVPWGLTSPLTISNINDELSSYANLGFSKRIKFDPTSYDNTLFGQFFEQTENELRKLDVIDYGTHAYVGESGRDVWQHVFFAGRMLVDDNGDDTFIHYFTLVFS
jgi:hypothetical protein